MQPFLFWCLVFCCVFFCRFSFVFFTFPHFHHAIVHPFPATLMNRDKYNALKSDENECTYSSMYLHPTFPSSWPPFPFFFFFFSFCAPFFNFQWDNFLAFIFDVFAARGICSDDRRPFTAPSWTLFQWRLWLKQPEGWRDSRPASYRSHS